MIDRVLLAGALALSACATAEPARTTEPIEQAQALPLQIAFQGLCNAATLAQAGDVQSAALTFEDQSHQYLHEFADRISVSDREGAARLLEAKQVVEAQIASLDTANPQSVAAALATLETALADGAEGAGFERPTCGGVPS